MSSKVLPSVIFIDFDPMNKFLFFLIALFVTPTFFQAQSGYISEKEAQGKSEAERIKEGLDSLDADYDFDEPISSLYDTLLLNTHNFRSDEVPVYRDEVYQERLNQIPAVISMDYNNYVKRYIEMYTQDRRDLVSRMLGLSEVYFPVFEEALDREGMPIELKYLPVVESALNPHARSRVGATGLWQFMLGTARMYDLKVNSYVDERKNPYKATEAAIQYLKRSYEEYGDWLLAIASYNCGPGNVRKAIARSGGRRISGKSAVTCRAKPAATFLPSSQPPMCSTTPRSTTSIRFMSTSACGPIPCIFATLTSAWRKLPK
jgi:hypothetical protein